MSLGQVVRGFNTYLRMVYTFSVHRSKGEDRIGGCLKLTAHPPCILTNECLEIVRPRINPAAKS